MTWTKLAPIAKSSGRPMASASVNVLKDGVAKVSVIFAASLRDAFDFDKADILAGSDEFAGCVRIEFGPAGAFEVRNFVHGGGRLYFPVPEGVPAQASAAFPCQVIEQEIGADDAARPEGWAPFIVLRLPVAEWARSARATPPAAKTATPPQAGQDPNAGKVDLVDYLTKKGLKVSRLAAGRFALDGETVTMAEVISRANQFRAKAGLGALITTQCW